MPIYDISLTLSPSLVVWPGDPPVTLTQPASMERGDMFNLTRMDISAHTGTHVDAPAHFVAGGAGVDSLDLDVLIGPALVVDARCGECAIGGRAGVAGDPGRNPARLVSHPQFGAVARGHTPFSTRTSSRSWPTARPGWSSTGCGWWGWITCR